MKKVIALLLGCLLVLFTACSVNTESVEAEITEETSLETEEIEEELLDQGCYDLSEILSYGYGVYAMEGDTFYDIPKSYGRMISFFDEAVGLEEPRSVHTLAAVDGEGNYGYYAFDTMYVYPVVKDGYTFGNYIEYDNGEYGFGFWGIDYEFAQSSILPYVQVDAVYDLLEQTKASRCFGAIYDINGIGIEEAVDDEVKVNLFLMDSDKYVFPMERGEEVAIGLMRGTTYEEITTNANCYFAIGAKNEEIAIEATPTKDGYFYYDLSSLEPGTYVCSLHSLDYGDNRVSNNMYLIRVE